MLRGIHLTLLIGPVVPVPVPQAVIEALESVEVTIRDSSDRLPSGFQLTFTLSNDSPLHTLFLLTAGAVVPIMRTILIATVNGTPNVLIDGVITNHQIAPGQEQGVSKLTVTGDDLTVLMDKIDFSGVPYPAMPAEARVAFCIAKYAVFGMIPLVIPSVLIDVPIPTGRIPRHHGTDLAYIRSLAAKVGYVFYVDAGPAPGVNTAYWGPQIKVGVPQSALNIDMDAHTNVESISFQYDGLSRKLPLVYIHNELTKVPIPLPIPDVTPLNPPLGLLAPPPQGVKPIRGTSRLSPPQAILMGMAHAAKMGDAVSASGTLNVLRYGRLLKARQLVGVRGAGLAFDGLYYVKSVTHRIKRGEYKQSFQLTRNGLVSITPKVVP